MEEMTFQELALAPEIDRAIDEMGFTIATGIQSEAIPLIREGTDVIGRSQTGTGKTLAFGIPALERAAGKDGHAVRVLIVCPTRELAQQASDELKKLGKYLHGLRIVEVYGGTPMDRQILRLKNADIVVGTPGRLMDHMRRHTLRLGAVEMVVLDEADEMLSMGFKENIETILVQTPEERQTVLFSATMPESILALTRQFQKDPKLIEINRQLVVVEEIEQFAVDAPMGRKMDVLNLLLRYELPQRAIIFCNTKRTVDEVTQYLNSNGFAAEGLHGDMNQSQRSKTMEAFKSGRVSLLIATDVAARGIDVNNVDYVFNYDVPQNTEYYVHRIGRTGRAGKSGKVVTIYSGRRQGSILRQILREAKAEMKMLDIPSMGEIQQKGQEKNIARIEEAIAAGIPEHWNDLVNRLLEKGHSLYEIAAAGLFCGFSESESNLEELVPAGVGREKLGQNRKLKISIGRMAHIAPNHIVAAIADRTSLSGGDIGKIEIFDDNTLVAVPAASLPEVIEAMQGCRINGQTVAAEAVEWKEPPRRPREGGYKRAAGAPRRGYDRKKAAPVKKRDEKKFR